MNRIGISATLPALIFLASTPALAQERETDTPADRFGAVQGEELQVSTSTEDSALTFRAELPTGPSQTNSFQLILSTPLNDDEDNKPASLDALANGSKVTLRWGRFELGDPTDTPYTLELEREAVEDCEEEEADDSLCDDAGEAVRKYRKTEYRRYLAQKIPNGATDYGIDATVGINDFEWVDATTLLPQKKRHTDWAVAAHIAHYLPGTAITGSVAYQRAYKAAEEGTICPPTSTDPADCVQARGAAPTRDKNLLISAGLRHRFVGGDGNLLNLAVAPEITYDVVDDIWGIDVPVYVVADKEGGLTGGIRFGYRSDRENKFSVGLFVGTTFGFFQ